MHGQIQEPVPYARLDDPQPLAQQQGTAVKDPKGNTVIDPNTNAPLASPTGSLQSVANAGKQFGKDLKTMMNTGGPDAFTAAMLAGLDAAVGHGGTFDYQRQHNSDGSVTFVSAFRDVSNYNIGLYAQQAGIPLNDVLRLAQGYASVLSKNYDSSNPSGGNPRNAGMIRLGYAAGASGVYGSGTTLP
jgi:hypothetical protein